MKIEPNPNIDDPWRIALLDFDKAGIPWPGTASKEYRFWEITRAPLLTRIAELEDALKVFADCAQHISEEEDDEEWAKFRLLIKNYRHAKLTLDASLRPLQCLD